MRFNIGKISFINLSNTTIVKVGVTFENSHINSNLCFRLSSNCNSSLIIFITNTILSWMTFLQQKNIIHFQNDICISVQKFEQIRHWSHFETGMRKMIYSVSSYIDCKYSSNSDKWILFTKLEI